MKANKFCAEVVSAAPALAEARGRGNRESLDVLVDLVNFARARALAVDELPPEAVLTRRSAASMLARHPEIVSALDEALRAHGFSCSYARSALVTGRKRRHGGGAYPARLFVSVVR